jgi:hypothetical protein
VSDVSGRGAETTVGVRTRAIAEGPPSAPQAVVPLTFLVLAACGLVGFAGALALGAHDVIVDSRGSAALAVVHLGLLAVLSTAVLGALHQFAPVVGARPLRSQRVARLTAFVFFGGAVALPTGFAHGPEWLVPAGGSLATTGILLAAWNLSRPLSSRSKGTPIVGLRWSVIFLIATASFGVVYAVDRSVGWFPLMSHHVLAHAHLGLLGWLGLTYIAVAEKLWPMFLLTHRSHARAGAWAVRLTVAGLVLLVPGLLFGSQALATMGGAVATAGMGAHLVALGAVIRHRRRRLELLHAFVMTAAVLLGTAIALGVVGALGKMTTDLRTRLVSAEIAALFGWILLAVIGHAHKVVPFIAWTALRARGCTTSPDGSPLLFAHLVDPTLARCTYVAATGAVVLLVLGMVTATQVLLEIAACAFFLTALMTTTNLVSGPVRALRYAARQGEMS